LGRDAHCGHPAALGSSGTAGNGAAREAFANDSQNLLPYGHSLAQKDRSTLAEG
jgi:hypothetical protein